ncbi:tRNA (32-2'-O)-methyltransferase regulator THADA-like [Mixophyes fleayi]|uniref:tRNA (32-2'-O)-methyltransferase regulator THADA-like n=1 Tax=Mixophyes fleayi TaxID=3061075 RepID=UPI003F4D80D2
MMAAPIVVHACEMLQEPGQCVGFYQKRGLSSLSLVALKLEQFAKASVKRCKEKHIDEAAQALESAEQILGDLTEDELLPLLTCILTCQIDSCNSLSFFLRLEKVLLKISKIRPCLVSQHRESFLRSLLHGKEVLQLRDMQTVCMYLEGSAAGRTYFKNHLQALLSQMSLNLSSMLQNQIVESTGHCHLTVKLCLLLFRELAENISPLVWDSAFTPNPVESILGSLLHLIRDQNVSRDARLLAGTAVASLANTGPTAESAAQAAMNLVQQLNNAAGELRFGELHVSVPGCPVDEVGLLAILRGLLTCGRRDFLTSELHISSQTMTLLDILLPVVASLCERQTEPYYSFQVLCLWLQRVREQLTGLLKVRGAFLLMDNNEIASLVTKLLWIGAEISVDGMSAVVVSCFQHYLHILRMECQLLALSEGTMLQDMLQKITDISWQARSRYTPLCALLPFLGPKKVLSLYPLLPDHLFCCVAINYLCPPAAEIYSILLTLQREEWVQEGQLDEKELGNLWAKIWLFPLSNALSSTEYSLRNNAATHLLPCTLRTFVESSNLLATRMNGFGPSQLRAWISLARAQKVIFGQVAGAEERLHLCLESADDGVRLSALSFLCCGPRSNQSPSSEELQLLKKYLFYNMGCDSPGFRQQLQAVLRRALERLRDGAMSAVRRGQSKEENVSQAIDFTEWLFQLSISSLPPAGNYQRRCSALITLCSLLESCTDCWSPQRKKGQPPQDMSLLLNLAKGKDCWDFLSARTMHVLLGCVQDSTNEIREMASDLLARFFLPAPESLTLTLFELGQKFLCSPRVPLAEAGAVLMKTLLQRPDESIRLAGDVPLSALGLVTYLTKMLQDQYCCAKENLLVAARTKPMHGVLSALRLCLLDVSAVSQSLSQADLAPSWRCLLKSLVSLLQQVASFILSMLHNAWGEEPPEVAAPSFEDMGKAVSVLIAQGRGLVDVQEDILLSEEHSLIMTCCWVSLKEIGTFLGPLVEKLVSGSIPLLPDSVVQGSVATYHDIFLRCRHWGAVDGCIAGFTRLCAALHHHKDPKLRALPREMMEQTLVRAQSQNSLSVTRRAAGFPVLLQCILSAEGPQHPLLDTCVPSLLALAREPLPCNWDQTRDLPQVSAVHALQTMLRSASLRSTLLNHAVPMMSLSLNSLRSPCWAMRNAALQLFTALSVGMLGLSRSDVDSSVQSTLHIGALLRRYPGLLDLLLQELRKAREEKEMLHPSLHPILTLLAKLQPGGDGEARCLMEPLLDLRENPIYSVRGMAARALVPVVQMTDYHMLLLQLTLGLPHTNEGVSHNGLHGRLLQIYALLSLALKENCISEGVRQEVAQKLLPSLWLLSPVQRCFLVRNVFLDILILLLPSCGENFAKQVQKAVCQELSAKGPLTQVGADAFHETCVQYVCNEAIRSFDQSIYSYVCQLLETGDTAVLKWLCERQVGDVPAALGHLMRDMLQDMLYKVLTDGLSNNLKLYLEGYVYLHKVCPTLPVRSPPYTKNTECTHKLLNLLESIKGGPQLRGHALCTLGLLLANGKLLDDLSLGTRWLSALFICADPAVSCEKLRLAAADALQLAGADLVKLAVGCGTLGLTQLAVRTVWCGVDLLQDEDRGVRELATRFAISVLNQPAERTLHSDWAILGLLELLRESFWSCEETFHALISRLPPYDLHAALCSFHDRSVTLYEEDEHNTFADPNFLSSLLCLFLFDLMGFMSRSESLCSVVQQWVVPTLIPVKEQIKRCLSWAEEQGSASLLWLTASGCSHVHAAVLGLLIRGELLIRAQEMLTQSGIKLKDLVIPPDSLSEELAQLKEELTLHGLGYFNTETKVRLLWRNLPSIVNSDL